MSKAQVFIPDDKYVWLQAEVVEEDVSNRCIVVQITDNINPCNDEMKTLSFNQFPNGASSLLLQNDCLDLEGVYDMCNLTHLHEPGILDNLRRRFAVKMPYTYTNEMCIAVNPYQWLNIYTDKLRDQYMNHNRDELMPHIYATSAAAFKGLSNPVTASMTLTAADLVKYRRNQSVIVSGESGAGKTESVKLLMDHIANMSQHTNDDMIDKVLKSNPLLESFGNAKTCRNDNSSRFGKFIELQFNESVQLIGSKCSTYLLEKSRVVMQSSVERNYHIFYQLLSAPEEVKQTLHLAGKSVHDFKYTAQGDTVTQEIEGRTDSERYHSTMNGLREDFALSDRLLDEVHCVLSGILHLGEVHGGTSSGNGNANDDGNSSSSGSGVVGGVETDADTPPTTDPTTVEKCCALFKLDPTIFLQELTSRYIDVEGSRVSVPLNAAQAIQARDALAKEIYSRLFNWLVVVINHNTSAKVDAAVNPPVENVATAASVAIVVPSTLAPASPVANTISLLDIFGFECFDGDNNRFEQLCINLANEKLQQLFASDMIRSVQQEYLAEGITTMQGQQALSEDNAGIIEMIEGKQRGSLISALNEECLIPQGSDFSYLNKIKTLLKGHPNFSNEIVSNSVTSTSAGGRVASGALNQSNCFTVSHYAGRVTYCVVGFMERNRDSLLGHLVEYMSSSGNALLACLFQNSMLYGTNGGSGGGGGAEAGPTLRRAQSTSAVVPTPSKTMDAQLKKGKSFAFPAVIATENDAATAEDLTSVAPAASAFGSADNNYLFTNAYLAELMGPSRCLPSDDVSSNSSSVVTPVKGGGRLTPPRRASFMLAETITSKFRSELSSLIATIAATRVHYVRCIKPNAVKSSTEFDRQLVVAQLRSAGMIDAVRIARASYPVRMPHKEFIFKYACLAADFKTTMESMSEAEKCHNIVASLDNGANVDEGSVKYDLKPFEIGLTRIYLTTPLLAQLNRQRTLHCHLCATKIQSCVRRWTAECRLHTSKVRITVIQKYIRRMLAVVRYRYKRCCIVLLQQCTRRLLAQGVVQRRREYVRATTLQAVFRGYQQRQWFKQVLGKVTLLQSVMRMRLKRTRYIVLRDKHRFDQSLLLQLSALKTTVETLETEKSEQSERRAAFMRELEGEKEKIFAAEAEIETLRTANEQLKQQMKNVSQYVQIREEECKVLRQQLKDVKAECDRQTARAEEFKSNLSKATNALVVELQRHKDERDQMQTEQESGLLSEVEQLLSVQSTLVNRKHRETVTKNEAVQGNNNEDAVNVVTPSMSPVPAVVTVEAANGLYSISASATTATTTATTTDSGEWTLLDEGIREDFSKLTFEVEKLIIVAFLLLCYILLL